MVDAGSGDDTIIAGEATNTVFSQSSGDEISVEGEGRRRRDLRATRGLHLADGNTGSVRERRLNWSKGRRSQRHEPDRQRRSGINGFTQNTGSVEMSTFTVIDSSSKVL